MKVFISHSSKDKERFCNLVAQKLVEKLGKEAIVYDALTFEAGEKSIDEINRTLSCSDLYVILLSQPAVDSRYVKCELSEAYQKLNDNKLDRIYPIIIDDTLKYTDPRIPDWLREYNLKYIASPAKVAKLIVERAKDVKWKRYSPHHYRNNIFVGRNELVNDFEVRIDDFDKATVNTYIVSGLPNIGRKSLARHCIIKGNISQPWYEFAQISLSYQESIEDFIIKINDLGFTDINGIPDFSNKTIDDKISYAENILKSICNLNEIILIKDDGCIVDHRGIIADWFKCIASSPNLSERMLFVIVTKYKMNFESIRNFDCAFYSNVAELKQSERQGLLRRLCDINRLDLCKNELDDISRHLTGYPTQVYYAIDIIKRKGYAYLSRNYKLLSDFNEQEVSSLLEKHNDSKEVFAILALLCKYDAISINMLYDILSVTPGYIDVYESLFQESLIELEGVNGEYVRLNEVVRNYVARSGMKMLKQHRIKAHEIFKSLFSEESSFWYNSNDLLLAIRESVKHGKVVPTEYMIPSVFLKSMSDLYADMKYDDVVQLAKRALENKNTIDGKILYEIKYLLCSALAKLKKSDCLNEIQSLEYDDRTFLAAFYYRQIGKNDRALQNLNQLLERRPEMSKAKREKVLVLKNLQQYEDAMGLAKENYYLYSDNPYHIQAYFDCLINTYYKNPNNELLQELLIKLARIQSEKAQSMHGRCQALFYAYVEQDYDTAIYTVNQAITDFPKDKKYALIVKFDIAELFNDFETMESIIEELAQDKNGVNNVTICKCKLYAAKGESEKAVNYFLKNICFFTDESKNAFCEKLQAKALNC